MQVDPQLAYINTAWWLVDATGAYLYRWSHGAKLVPEVASRVVVSDGGLAYTFTLRRVFRFSDGASVSARSFAYAIRRLRNRDLASPGAALAVGIARVTACGRRRVIRLAWADPALLSKLALPFFQATSTKLPLNREVTGPYPSAGRYAYTRNDINVLTSIRRNPYWTQGSPGQLDGVDIRWNQDPNTVVDEVEAGRLDEVAGVPAAERQSLADRYGVGNGRFRVRPSACIGYVALNGLNPLLRNNPQLRKAISFAVDRTAYAGSAGPFGATPWTHLVPSGTVQP